MKFYNYQRKEVDLIQHCLEQKAKFGRNLLVFIGTDSISVGGQCHYFTVVAFRYGKTGAHFIYSKSKFPVVRLEGGKPDIYMKLWREATLTMEIAELLTSEKVFNKEDIVIEFDYNGLVKTLSTQLVAGAKGWAMQLGYNTLTKCGQGHEESTDVIFGNEIVTLYEQVAVKAANHLCQGI